MRRILLTLTGIILLFLLWLFRPDPTPLAFDLPESLPAAGFTVEQAEKAIRDSELRAGPLKADNHARIYWNPEYLHSRAPCAIVYLHGFSATHSEGSPLHVRMARSLGCHLYLTRLHGHGLRARPLPDRFLDKYHKEGRRSGTPEPLYDFHPDSLLHSAGHALSVGTLLGEEVILMGTSMGGMLALYLAARFPESVDMLVLLSPLISFSPGPFRYFDRPWFQRIMRLYLGGHLIEQTPANDDHRRYWYMNYHIRSLMELKHIKSTLVSHTILSDVTQPVFTGYYYKDEKNQDKVVSVSAIKDLEMRISTPEKHRAFRAFPRAGQHVIASSHRSADFSKVEKEVFKFLYRRLDQE